jgi:3-oxoacyl-[acyl-carrier-protein] synthase III
MIALAAGAAALIVVFTVWAICRSAWQDPDNLDALINATREPRDPYVSPRLAAEIREALAAVERGEIEDLELP